MSFLISVFILDDLSPNIAKYSDKINVLKFVWIAKSTKGNYKKRNFLKFGKQLLTFWSILQTIVAGFASLLVLETTNRKTVELIVVEQERVDVVVVQTHVVRVEATVLGRTPEVREVTLVEVTPIVVPVAGRKRRKPEGILVGNAAIRRPASLGLQLGTRRI